MKNYTGKFEVLAEETLGRFQQNGFLTGDYVKIKDNWSNNDYMKSMSQQMKDMVKAIKENNTYLRVSYVKSGRGGGGADSAVGSPNVPGCLWADVVVEYAPGMWKDPMTLPLEILEKVDIESESSTEDTEMSAYPQYNQDIRRDNNLQIEPVEVEATDNREETPDDDHNLPGSNTKLANTPQPKDGLKQVNAGAVKKIKKDIDLINEAYYAKKVVREGFDAVAEQYADRISARFIHDFKKNPVDAERRAVKAVETIKYHMGLDKASKVIEAIGRKNKQLRDVIGPVDELDGQMKLRLDQNR